MSAEAAAPVAPAQPTANPTTAVAPLSVPKIPADYAALGVVGGYQPPAAERLRFFIIGPSGDGKTSFVASIPKTLILDFEGGAWGIPNPRAVRIVCKTYKTFKAIYEKLIIDGKAGRRAWDRVVFDTLDQFVEMMNPMIALAHHTANWKGTDITDYGGKGAGWAILKNECWKHVTDLEQAGYAWSCVGHVTEKTITINNKDRTVIRPVLFDTFAKLVARNSDYFINVHSKIEAVQQYKVVSGKQYPSGTKDVPVYVMSGSAIGSSLATQQTKQRGVPTMPATIRLPDTMSGESGWEAFCTAYYQSVEEVRSKTEKTS